MTYSRYITDLRNGKSDDSFPIGQFPIEGSVTPIRFDCNQNGDEIMLLSREAIPIKLLSTEIALIESFYVEINYISLKKKRSLLNAFFVSQFSHCPLVWMCHSRTLNNRMD